MGQCDNLINRAIDINCSDPITKGLEANGVIINRKDIDFGATTFAASGDNTIETLVLRGGVKGYEVYVPGATPYTGTKVSLEKGAYLNTFVNDVSLVVLDNGPDVSKGVVDALANGEFVLILENKHKGKANSKIGSSAFQVFGYYQGLRAETIENDKYSEDAKGGWMIVLKETGVPKSALFLFKTDYATTKTAIETLTSPST